VIKKSFFIAVSFLQFIIFSSYTLAQSYAGSPCQNYLNPNLKTELKTGTFSDKTGIAYNFFEKLSSSYLKPQGTSPYQNGHDVANDPDGEEEIAEKRDLWACQYTAYSLQDKNDQTSWCEGVEGDGLGEVVMAAVKTDTAISILPGLGKSDQLFKANNRVKKANIYRLAAKTPLSFSTTETNFLKGLRLIDKNSVEFQDRRELQQLPLKFPKDLLKENEFPWIAIEIVEVYPGTTYHDTCIAEISD